MTKLIAAVRNIDVFAMLCRRPPRKLQELTPSFEACAIEADRAMLKTQPAYDGPASCSNLQNSFTSTGKVLFESFLVDHLLQGTSGEEHDSSTFKGYGDPPNFNNRKRINFSQDVKNIPCDVCIICQKKVCHLSKHFKTGAQTYQNFVRVFLVADHIEDD